jgi:hypothetical protein
MLEAIFNDFVYAFRSTFFSSDWRTIAIALGAALLASFVMSRRGQIGSVTLLALLLFAIGGILRGIFMPLAEKVSLGDRTMSLVKSGVAHLMDMQAGLLIAYFLAFMAVILVMFGLRSAAGAGGGHH